MRWTEFKKITEDGRIVKGVNTSSDVGPNEIAIQAAKFGNKVDKDGRPPTLSRKVRGKSTNVLFNLGLAEGIEDKLGEISQSTEIYIDMDGVLADFFGAWAQLMDVKHWADINKKDSFAGGLEKIRNSDDFWLELPLLPQATQLLNLVRNVKGEYNICSSPLADDPNSEPHKHEWIKKNLSFFPPKNVYITHNKEQFATQEDGTPNILIDDFGKNIKKWEDAGGYGFKYKDHKFERTAAQIKQHMQEPVEENIKIDEAFFAYPVIVALLQAGKIAVKQLIKRFGRDKVKQSQKELTQATKKDNVVSFKGKNVGTKKTKASNDNTKSPEQKMIDKLLEPRSADAVKFTRAVNLQKVEKFKATGDVAHLQGLPASQVYQAGEAVRKGGGAEALRQLAKLSGKQWPKK